MLYRFLPGIGLVENPQDLVFQIAIELHLFALGNIHKAFQQLFLTVQLNSFDGFKNRQAAAVSPQHFPFGILHGFSHIADRTGAFIGRAQQPVAPLSQQMIHRRAEEFGYIAVDPLDHPGFRIDDDHSGGKIVQQSALQRFVVAQLLALTVFLRHVAENEYGSDDAAVRVMNRRAAVRNLKFCAVARDQCRVIRQSDDAVFAQRAVHRYLSVLPRSGVDNAEDFGNRPSGGFAGFPARQLFRDDIEAGHTAAGVAGDHAVADRTQGGREERFAFLPCGRGLMQRPVIILLGPQPEYEARCACHANQTEQQNQNGAGAGAPVGEHFGGVLLGHQKPGGIRNRLERRQHIHPAIVLALHDAFMAQHGHHSRHLGLR